MSTETLAPHETMTPGPWKASERTTDLRWRVTTADDAVLVVSGIKQANAHAIAALPELLEAVESLLKHMDMSKVTVRNGFSLLVAHNAARKAVDKARGIRHVPELLPAAEPTGGVA